MFKSSKVAYYYLHFRDEETEAEKKWVSAYDPDPVRERSYWRVLTTGHVSVIKTPAGTEGRMKWMGWKWRPGGQPGSSGSSSGEGQWGSELRRTDGEQGT